ncbi:hypothetical protein BJX66DRAFT_301190 [Aspergillus keveii]|uniref:Uncharacterized protein n=1 Tax=Aspergillus keveii TaxID=714993 RepID=A0ABR4GAW9_9EURO
MRSLQHLHKARRKIDFPRVFTGGGLVPSSPPTTLPSTPPSSTSISSITSSSSLSACRRTYFTILTFSVSMALASLRISSFLSFPAIHRSMLSRQRS